jgi:hypothetical protein
MSRFRYARRPVRIRQYKSRATAQDDRYNRSGTEAIVMIGVASSVAVMAALGAAATAALLPLTLPGACLLGVMYRNSEPLKALGAALVPENGGFGFGDFQFGGSTMNAKCVAPMRALGKVPVGQAQVRQMQPQAQAAAPPPPLRARPMPCAPAQQTPAPVPARPVALPPPWLKAADAPRQARLATFAD